MHAARMIRPKHNTCGTLSNDTCKTQHSMLARMDIGCYCSRRPQLHWSCSTFACKTQNSTRTCDSNNSGIQTHQYTESCGGYHSVTGVALIWVPFLPCSMPRLVSPYTSSVLTLMKRLIRPVMRAASNNTWVPYVLFIVNAKLLPKLLST